MIGHCPLEAGPGLWTLSPSGGDGVDTFSRLVITMTGPTGGADTEQ